MDMSIRFPHLGIYLPNVGKTISVFGFDIAYYGITIAIAMIVGISIALHEVWDWQQDRLSDGGVISLTVKHLENIRIISWQCSFRYPQCAKMKLLLLCGTM